MATSASLVVRISADLNDFARQLDAMTKGVAKAASKIEGFGKALTIGITAPVLAAAAALAKLGAENEDVAGRLERVFGNAAASVDASIAQMMKSIPETGTELRKLAISADNMAQGLGLAPPKAAEVSQSLLKLAGDAAAFAHVPIEQAMDALSRGLAGRTRGLLEFGIAINQADIKARALQMGILHVGNEITETGTALAAYSLIMDNASRIQGEAERTAGQAGKSFAFLKRDLSELADNVSGLVLPALSDLAKGARDVVKIFATMDTSTVTTFFKIAAAAALIGPTIIALVRLVDVFVKLRAAIVILSAGGTVVGFIAALAALPIATIVAGIAAITVAVTGLYYAWQKLTGSSGQLPTTRTIGPVTFTQIGQGEKGARAAANQPTERAPARDAMKALQERIQSVDESLKQMGKGWEIPGLTMAWFRVLGDVQARLAKIKDQLSPDATKLRAMIDELKAAAAEAFAPTQESKLRALAVPGIQTVNLQQIAPFNPQAAPLPGLSLATEAAIRYAESQDYATERTGFDYQALRSTLDSFGIHLKNVGEGMQRVAVTLASAVYTVAQQLVSTLGGPGANAGIGRGLGGLAGGVVGSFFGPAGFMVGSVIGTGIGGLVGGLFDHAKASTDNAASSLDNLATTAAKVAASITNIPAFFKVELERFRAAPITQPPPIDTGPGSPITNPIFGGKTPTPATHSIVVNGNLVVQSSASTMKALMDDIYQQAAKQKATGSRAPFVFAPQAAFAG